MRRSLHFIIVAASVSAALSAHAQPTDATALSGRWSGTYHCIQGITALELTLRGNAHGLVHGTFAFSPTPQNPEVLTGSYPVLGRLTGTSLVLRPIDVHQMPGRYVPVGIQATVAADGGRLQGWIEGPRCGVVAVERTAPASPTDALDGGYGAQQWTPIAEAPSGVLYADTRELPPSGVSTRRLWVRWHGTDDDPGMGLLAGQAVEWEMEFDCEAALVRTWHTLVYAPDGQLQHVDASAPYTWTPVAEGALEEFAWEQACSDPEQ
jgi:hypothetical protein